MRFAFTEEQEALRRTVRQFLSLCSSPDRVRAAMATEAGFDPETWRRVAAELGLTSLIIPEAHGGAGLGHVELALVMEEMGRALFCAPFFSTIALAANALVLAGGYDGGHPQTPGAQRDELLPAIAAGSATATLAYTEANGRWDARAVEAIAARDGGDYLITGVKTFVIDGHTADYLLVAARAPGTFGAEGVSLFVVPAGAEGVFRRPLPTMDATRKQAEIRLDRVRVPASSLLGGEGLGWSVIAETLDLACIALSAEQVGGMQRCLDMAVDYAKVRVQFGRPIGSFQAIKHKCADMLLRTESARSASYYAGWAAATRAPDRTAAAATAKAYCSDAYFFCAAENIQIHGGIGFTWEHDAHLYFKRARASEALFGDATYHRERVAKEIGL
jgi:alkylation response protein AidB-like acyl-CoA dehydrogenase